MLRQSLSSGKFRTEVPVRYLRKVALALVVLAALPFYAHADVSVPDTPAGHTLKAFLDAFNSGGHERIAAM
ncbi:MAG TPA: hypothetical protein VJO35_13770 [Terriglobales bacterium]|nr:hypothetical protein [Terriglobales bacterium]